MSSANLAKAASAAEIGPQAENDTVDFVIVGSGFGGSVAALRLVEKGYSVSVLEMGKRWNREDFAKTNWDLRRFLWKPRLGLHGILQLTLVRDAFFLHGCGVGGGSLVYANTLLEPPSEVFEDPRWVGLDWQATLAPHYRTARRMLGAVESPVLVETDRLLREVATEMGRGDTFHRHTVGVYFSPSGQEPGQDVPDPYFDGEGPERAGCTMCGACMVGCRVGAKNTLDRNYLYLAEKRGAVVHPETRVVDVRPIGRTNGHDGYQLTVERSIGFLRQRRTIKARRVVFAAGSVGTADLLLQCRERGSLTNLSPTLGTYLRTNSEALLAVKSKDDVDYSRGIAITSGAYLDATTHVEIVRYPSGSDAMAFLSTVLTSGGGSIPRPLRWLGSIFRHPLQFLRSLNPVGFAKKGAILLVMQPIDNHLRYVLRRRWYWPFGKSLDSDHGEGGKVPVYIPLANEAAKRMAVKMNGDARSGIVEVLTGRATTAHVFGGCPLGQTSTDGVVDLDGKVHGYEGLYITDGSILPANLGVNPSLTITAMAEHVMAQVAPKPG